jgi:uncharacterized protein YfcZ (UPF0381/DUF406 family)
MTEATSLNDIYRSIGELTGAVKALGDKIEDNERRNVAAIDQANESRATVHKRLDDLVDRVGHVEADTADVKRKVEAVEKVTIEVTTLRAKAEGAGTLGRWLLVIGGGVLSAAGWVIGAYTYLTGRPPP